MPIHRRHAVAYPRQRNPTLVPTVPVEIDWDHALARGLVGCYLPGRPDDLTGNGPPLTALDLGLTSIGPAFNSGASAQNSFPTAYQPGAAFSCFAFIETYTTNSYHGYVGVYDNTTGYNSYNALNLESYGTVTFLYNNGVSGIPGGATAIVAWSAAGNPLQFVPWRGSVCGTLAYGGNAKVYIGGSLLLTQGAPAGPAYIGPSALSAVSMSAQNWRNALAAWFNVEKTASEIAWFQAEPFAMFRPVVRRTYSIPVRAKGLMFRSGVF